MRTTSLGVGDTMIAECRIDAECVKITRASAISQYKALKINLG